MPYAYDPDLQAMADLIPHLTIEDLGAARQMLEAMLADVNAAVDTSGLEITDAVVPGPEGAPDVPVRIYTPVGEAVRPALLSIHGGGFVLGSMDMDHAAAVLMAKGADAVVVSVEYRLAPEHPYPAGLEDCYAALCWLHDHAAELGVDPTRLAVGGQSAGGGLSAGLALLARDRGGPPLAFQLLGIPELDDRLDTPSMRTFTDTPMWHRPNAELSWRYYLGDLAGGDDVPAYAAPSRATDLAGLPPAYVTTMEFDPLRDEGILYALGLLQAGVPVELHSFPGTFHGSAMVVDAGVSQRQAAEQAVVLRRALHPPR